MNTLMMIVVVVVLFCYFGGKYCPSVLKKNKQILLGLAGGLVLCSFFGLRLEGFNCPDPGWRSGGEEVEGSAAACCPYFRNAMHRGAPPDHCYSPNTNIEKGSQGDEHGEGAGGGQFVEAKKWCEDNNIGG